MSLNKQFDISEEDTQRVLVLFQQFHPLNVWSKVKKEDFTMKRFENGYVNNIICCEMTEEVRKRLCKKPDDCAGIVVKFSYNDNFTKIDRLEEAVMNTTISAAGLGPRLLFINNECMVHELVKSRHYHFDDDRDEETVKQMARVLARFHALRPPISNKGLESWAQAYNTIFQNAASFQPVFGEEYLKVIKEGPAELKEKYYSLLEEFKLEKLAKHTQGVLDRLNSPVVFLHSDVGRHNTLVEERLNENGNKGKRIYLVDFDYSIYAPRGHDFAAYFSVYHHRDDFWGTERFPTDEEMKIFLEAYRLECECLQPGYLDDPINSINRLIKESKLYALKQYLTLSAFAVSLIFPVKDDPEKVKEHLQGFANRFNGFKELKKQFISEGLMSADSE